MREVDDFEPQVQIKKAVKEGNLSLDNEESMEEFSKTYIKEKPLLTKCLQQINVNELKKAKRAQERKAVSEAEINQSYEQFDWLALKTSNQIRKLKASTLNEYITHHGLQSIMKYRKNVKVGIIENHIASQELLRHSIKPNKVHEEPRNCNTRDPEMFQKTRNQSVL